MTYTFQLADAIITESLYVDPVTEPETETPVTEPPITEPDEVTTAPVIHTVPPPPPVIEEEDEETEAKKETAAPTTKQPTTAQPTTVAATTVQPTTAPVKDKGGNTLMNALFVVIPLLIAAIAALTGLLIAQYRNKKAAMNAASQPPIDMQNPPHKNKNKPPRS